MKKEIVDYEKLDSKQKELYNFQLLSKILGSYGYLCTRLTADWSDADFIAQHYKTGKVYKIQQKTRLTIAQRYIKKDLYLAFPYKDRWFIVPHDKLLEIVAENNNYLRTKTWQQTGEYSIDGPSEKLINQLSDYEWSEITVPFLTGKRKAK